MQQGHQHGLHVEGKAQHRKRFRQFRAQLHMNTPNCISTHVTAFGCRHTGNRGDPQMQTSIPTTSQDKPLLLGASTHGTAVHINVEDT